MPMSMTPPTVHDGPMGQHDEPVRDNKRLREGLCPIHATLLERRDEYGWCDECGHGWSLDANKTKVHRREDEASDDDA